MRRFVLRAGAWAVTAGVFATAAAADALVTFSNGTEGWNGPTGPGGATYIDLAGGNAAPSLRTQFNNFGIEFYNNTNPEFIGDYSRAPQASFSVDVNTRLINFFGQDVSRDLIVELRDYDNPPGGYPWVSVWYNFGPISAADQPWRSLSVAISDTSATDLPAGWGGYGAEDPNTFEPMLPADRTFASVLASVDEIAISTFVPGFFFGFTDFDVAIDNVAISFVPEPTSLLLLGLAALGLRRR